MVLQKPTEYKVVSKRNEKLALAVPKGEKVKLTVRWDCGRAGGRETLIEHAPPGQSEDSRKREKICMASKRVLLANICT